jgi:hypothetical protein
LQSQQSKNGNKNMTEEFKNGIKLGRKHFVEIAAHSDRWKKRNVPAFIRESLLVPYYIVESNGYLVLYIIQFPISSSEKVQFIPFARSEINEEESPEISYRKK